MRVSRKRYRLAKHRNAAAGLRQGMPLGAAVDGIGGEARYGATVRGLHM